MLTKKNFLRILIVFLIFFTVGFIRQWGSLTGQYQKCINKEYSTKKNSDGMDFNEWWLEIHDNFSTEYKAESSFYGGLTTGVLGTVVSLYVYILYKLFSSKNEKKIRIGAALVIAALICLASYFYFVANFEIVF